MGIEHLAQRLADKGRIGLTPELADKLRVRDEDTVRAQLLSEQEEGRGHLGVYIVAVYVVDDTDFWDDGEIYWWAVPTLVDRAGKATWGVLSSLPSGAAPHKVGSKEWMTNISLQDSPLIAVIPPSDDVASVVIRLAIYDDDNEIADLPRAMTAGLEVLAGFSPGPLGGPDQIILPVRDAIYRSLKGNRDDVLIDQDLGLKRGAGARFGAGLIGSMMNKMARVYYFVRDEDRTEQAGPFELHKGQTEAVRFKATLEPGGRVAILARGADVNVASLGTLNTDTPFINHTLDVATARNWSAGLNVSGTGPAKLVAYYTPP
jgi:hypothetical protein